MTIRQIKLILKKCGCVKHKDKLGCTGHIQEQWLTPAKQIIHIPHGRYLRDGVARQYQQILNREGITVRLHGGR